MIFCAVDLLRELGLDSTEVKVRISHREAVRSILAHLGVADERMEAAFGLLDAKALIAVGETKSDPALAPAELAAWTLTCNQLMNLDEFLNK